VIFQTAEGSHSLNRSAATFADEGARFPVCGRDFATRAVAVVESALVVAKCKFDHFCSLISAAFVAFFVVTIRIPSARDGLQDHEMPDGFDASIVNGFIVGETKAVGFHFDAHQATGVG
jgi:hypothetical protein